MIVDLPELSSMLTRLFESSQHLDNDALKYLIDALCKLSHESMELASSNQVIIYVNYTFNNFSLLPLAQFYN